MKSLKNRILWLTFFSIIGIIAGYFFSNAYEFGLCIKYDPFCNQEYLFLSDKLFYSSIALAFIFFILLFVPRAVSVWWKFARWYIPIVAFLIITGKPDASGGVGVLSGNFGPSFQESVIGAAVIYVVVSLILIVRATWFKKKQK